MVNNDLGIAESATLLNGLNIVGEAGAEAILPLQGANGDYWMNKVADKISSNITINNQSNNDNRPLKITLKLNELELGEATVNSLKAVADYKGELDLPL